MTLADERLKGLDNASLTVDERALLRCQVAADFIHRGQYEVASEALGELWWGIGERPNVEGLSEKATAEALLQAGALSGWMGASRQVAGAQASAKDLISESITLFESLGERAWVATARSDLALCYWREGAYDEARVILTKASDEAANADAEQRAKILLRWVNIECAAGRFNNALGILREVASILDESDSHALRGSFHSLHASTLQQLATAERHADYFDKAIIEYTAAIYHYELARHERYAASIQNNLAFLLYKLGRYADAHEHLDRAGVTLVRLNDAGLLAQVDETRARVLIAEKQYREASKIIAGAVKALEQGGEAALLADALTIQGIAWARLGGHESSINILRRAANVAEESGALSNAATAMMTLIEEHGAKRSISKAELYNLYQRTDKLLKDTQNAGEVDRLRACARIVMRRLAGIQLSDKNFTLHGAVQELEAKFIEWALDEAGGSITRAAKLLGIHHQTLTAMLQTRHKRLQSKRTPPEKRLKSIIRKDS